MSVREPVPLSRANGASLFERLEVNKEAEETRPDTRGMGPQATERRSTHTVDFDPFIKSQPCLTEVISRPCVL